MGIFTTSWQAPSWLWAWGRRVFRPCPHPIRANLSLDEQERAINDAVHKIKKESLDYRARNATDISDLQNIIKEQSMLQKIHITLS